MSKADLKRSQLPVTVKTPYVCEPIPVGLFPDMVPVLDPLGGFLFWADEQLARSLVKKHQVRIFRTKHKVRALQALGDLVPPPETAPSQARFFGIPHRRETDDNPVHVWTQDRMGNGEDKRARFCRKVCMAVVTSCSTKKAA